jgi:hypothetical protein
MTRVQAAKFTCIDKSFSCCRIYSHMQAARRRIYSGRLNPDKMLVLVRMGGWAEHGDTHFG